MAYDSIEMWKIFFIWWPQNIKENETIVCAMSKRAALSSTYLWVNEGEILSSTDDSIKMWKLFWIWWPWKLRENETIVCAVSKGAALSSINVVFASERGRQFFDDWWLNWIVKNIFELVTPKYEGEWNGCVCNV